MPIMFSLLSANLINVIANWTLIFGHWGFRKWVPKAQGGQRASPVYGTRTGDLYRPARVAAAEQVAASPQA
jgi:hypothetical protein